VNMQKGNTLQSGIRTEMVVRLPILLLSASILALFLILPYQSLNSDVTTFGLMGNDLLRHGYLPTLTYGQNYLFSITPYVYALVRRLAPSFSCALALTLAGALISVTGLWLVYESFLAAQRRMARPLFIPALLFCLLIGASHSYGYDLSENSGLEISILLLGVVLLTASRIEAGLYTGRKDNWGAWITLGSAASYAVYSRPQIAAYAVCLICPLLYMIGRRMGWYAFFRNAVWLVIGLCIGYFPMLCHDVFRAANWPFAYRIHTPMGSGHQMVAALRLLWNDIMPRMFMVSRDAPVYSVLIIALAMVALVAGGAALARWRGITVTDIALVGGSLIVLAVMIALPNLSVNQESRRYCLHTFLAVVWLFCRFCVPSGRRAWPAIALVTAIVFLTVAPWRARLQDKVQRNAQVRIAEREFVPELMRYDTPVLCNYWDAYLLAFLSDGRLKIDAFPWQLVRTYGWLKKSEMRRQTLWLIRSGYGHDTFESLKKEIDPNALITLAHQDFSMQLFNSPCELWFWDDGSVAVELMQKHHPRYFTTTYPPGSVSQCNMNER
jgi:hypothetical protein